MKMFLFIVLSTLLYSCIDNKLLKEKNELSAVETNELNDSIAENILLIENISSFQYFKIYNDSITIHDNRNNTVSHAINSYKIFELRNIQYEFLKDIEYIILKDKVKILNFDKDTFDLFDGILFKSNKNIYGKSDTTHIVFDNRPNSRFIVGQDFDEYLRVKNISNPKFKFLIGTYIKFDDENYGDDRNETLNLMSDTTSLLVTIEYITVKECVDCLSGCYKFSINER